MRQILIKEYFSMKIIFKESTNALTKKISQKSSHIGLKQLQITMSVLQRSSLHNQCNETLDCMRVT